MKFSLVAAVLGAAALAACGSTPPPAPVPQAAPTTTTTVTVPGADPAAWFDAYCGPMGVTQLARRDIPSKAAPGPEAMRTAVVGWAQLTATSGRKMADDLEKLGPLGSDVQNPHERLVKALRDEAKRFDEAAVRLQAERADAKFPERYEQIMISVASENAQALFKQIVDVPKYGEAFRANQVCLGWQELARGN
ncbi:hypothetical protein [Lentzea sp. NBRC 102530]|uniref:hypothetical protein n=1 Tax=Lentzea sp. NBRC 102530 TaxID=3032201 RepID=UPI0024A3EC67|nr:hypothetical protein [Lentzea sp. NBRC 102530]GLY47877.1 hypothetical protein Lesp01_15330 [Lentzea sp. NBRC 102530]